MLAGGRSAWMGKPYSMDLRERVVAAVDPGGLSCHRAAAQFGVGVNTAILWVRRSERPAALRGPDGWAQAKKISGKHRDWLLERTKARDFTLRGRWPSRRARAKVDYRSVWSSSTPIKLQSVVASERERPGRRRCRRCATDEESGPRSSPERGLHPTRPGPSTQHGDLAGLVLRRQPGSTAEGPDGDLEDERTFLAALAPRSVESRR